MVRLAADGRWAISGDYDGRVCLWDAQTGESVANVRVFKRNLTGLAFHPDGATLAVSVPQKIRLLDASDGTEKGSVPVGLKGVYGTSWTPDSARLALAAADGRVRVWEMS